MPTGRNRRCHASIIARYCRIALTSCGSDSGDGGTVTPSTPVLAPTPMPAPTYASFPSTGEQSSTLPSAYAAIRFNFGVANGLADAATADYDTGGGVSLVSPYPNQPGEYRFAAKIREATSPFFKGVDSADARREHFGSGFAPSQLFALNNLSLEGIVGELAYQLRYSS